MLDFRSELFRFIDMIDRGVNFSLSRYGDGEKMLMNGQSVTECSQAWAQDNWKSKGMTSLGQALKKTLLVVEDNFYYAIPCRCCNDEGKQWYKDNIINHNFTFANLFINNNYQYFREWLKELQRDVILIANYEGIDKKYPFKVKEFHSMPDDCVNYFDSDGAEMIEYYRELAKNNTNALFFISAGPLANILVYEMYSSNPNNTYIDMGSALDEFTKNRITRGFQRREDSYAQRYCIF